MYATQGRIALTSPAMGAWSSVFALYYSLTALINILWYLASDTYEVFDNFVTFGGIFNTIFVGVSALFTLFGFIFSFFNVVPDSQGIIWQVLLLFSLFLLVCLWFEEVSFEL
jgi:hypothetical protein